MPQRELHAEREAAHVRPQFTAASARSADLLQLAEHALRIVGIDEHCGDHHRSAVALRDLFQPWHRGGHALGEHEYPFAGFAQRAGELQHLVLVGEARGHWDAVLAVVLLECRGGEAHRAGLQRFGHQLLHLRDLRLGRRALGGVLAQHERAYRRMADEGRDVGHCALALEQAQVVGIALEVPVHPGAQRFQRHAFDVSEIAQREIAVARPARRDGEAAVADHHAGHAQCHRRRRERIPQELRIVVGVQVDDAGGQRQALCVDPAACGAEVLADGGDAAVLHRQVACAGRRAEPVDERCVFDYEVVHGNLPGERCEP